MCSGPLRLRATGRLRREIVGTAGLRGMGRLKVPPRAGRKRNSAFSCSSLIGLNRNRPFCWGVSTVVSNVRTFGPGWTVGRHPDAGDHRVFVHIKPRAAWVENVHGSLHPLRRRRRARPLFQSLNSALPGLAAHGAIGGASGAPGPTNTRAHSHHENRQPLRRQPQRLPQVHPRRVDVPVAD